MRLQRLRSWPSRLQMRKPLLMPSCLKSKEKHKKLRRRRPNAHRNRLRRRKLKLRLKPRRRSGIRGKRKNADLKRRESRKTRSLAIRLELLRSLKRKRLRVNCRQQPPLLLGLRARKSSKPQFRK